MTVTHAIVDVAQVNAKLVPHDWTFSRDRRADIDAHWRALVAEKPKMFNGRVLLQHHGDIRDNVFHADYFATDYSDFIAWQRFGYPPPAVRNGFAMAALRAADGAFLLGEMAAHTVNAGKIYFAAGTPDLDDVRADGSVDLAGSLLRELEEETGLDPSECAAAQGWTLAMSDTQVAFMRPVILPWPADEARALIRSRIARQAEPELSDIVIIRSAEECAQERMPAFMRTYLRHALALSQPG